jgi:hypothetical protein
MAAASGTAGDAFLQELRTADDAFLQELVDDFGYEEEDVMLWWEWTMLVGPAHTREEMLEMIRGSPRWIARGAGAYRAYQMMDSKVEIQGATDDGKKDPQFTFKTDTLWGHVVYYHDRRETAWCLHFRGGTYFFTGLERMATFIDAQRPPVVKSARKN